MRILARLLAYYLIAVGVAVHVGLLAVGALVVVHGPRGAYDILYSAAADARDEAQRVYQRGMTMAGAAGGMAVGPAEDAFRDRETPEVPPLERLGYGRTLRVGPGHDVTTPGQAADLAEPGDIIEIEAGDYPGDTAIWRTDDLWIRGVGGTVRLDATGSPLPQDKAIWLIQGDNVRVENVEFTGADSPDENGAGIRAEGKLLHVVHCYFHDNETGILTNNVAGMRVVVEHSEFARNGHPNGSAHQLYAGRIASLELRYSYFHGTVTGSAVKSRAASARILFNRIVDGAHGRSNYSIDLSNGGDALVIGNVIHQGAETGNYTLLTYAPEGLQRQAPSVFVVHNTFASSRTSASFVRNHSNATLYLYNNLFIGPGVILDGKGILAGNVAMAGDERSRGDAETLGGDMGSQRNRSTRELGIADAAAMDFSLREGSAAVDAGLALGKGGDVALSPRWEYAHPAGKRPRRIRGNAPDAGAFELKP